MKKAIITVFGLILMFGLSACGNAEHRPEFISAREGAELLRPMPVGAEGWRISFVDANYIIAHPLWGLLSIRYNINENKVDRVLHWGWPEGSFRTLAISHWLNGNRAVIWTTSPGVQDDEFWGYSYVVDFEHETIHPWASVDEDFFPPAEERFLEWGFRTFDDSYYARRHYNAFIEATPGLSFAGDWTEVAQIDEDRFVLLMPVDGEMPGPGYFYFKFVIVDVSQGEVVQEFALSSMA